MKIKIEASPNEVAILKSKVTLDRFSMASDPRFREDQGPFKFWLEGFLNKETEWSGGDAATLRNIQSQFTESCKHLQAMIDSVQSAEGDFGGSREIDL